jgi:adenylate kinase
MNVIILGAPGAGKGTHCKLVRERYGLEHISTGDMLRAEVAEGTQLGQQAKGYMDAGKLVPDDLIIDMIMKRFAQSSGKGLLLDGFPRTVAQAKALDEKVNVDIVIDLAVTDAVVIKRITGRRVCPNCNAIYNTNSLGGRDTCSACGGKLVQRADDNEETIKKRLESYYAYTAPLIDYYRGKGLLHTVDSETGVEQGFADINALLEQIK